MSLSSVGLAEAAEAPVEAEAKPAEAKKAEEPKQVADAKKADDDSLLGFDTLGGDLVFVPSLSYRVRYYHREGNDFQPGRETNRLRHRARVGLEARYLGMVSTFLQFQDVRFWGEEGDLTGDFSADGFDLHQGYLTLGTERSAVTIGRQEIGLGNQRVVGRAPFNDAGRSFDAIRSWVARGDVRAEVFWALARDNLAQPTFDYGKRHLLAAVLDYRLHRAIVPHVLVTFEADQATALRRVTAGGTLDGTVGQSVAFAYHGEGWVQGGRDGRAEASHSIFTYLANFGVKATPDLESKPYLGLDLTLSSGDDDPDDDVVKTFDTPYGSRHRFFGQSDVFTQMPRDTDERGIRDIAGTLGWVPFGTDLSATLHVFDAMRARGTASGHFGWELDLRAQRWFFDDHLGFDLVYSFFVPGAFYARDGLDPKLQHFAYVTVETQF
ncbi:MAG: alginate export family protein [Polyangiaceae bacterium]